MVKLKLLKSKKVIKIFFIIMLIIKVLIVLFSVFLIRAEATSIGEINIQHQEIDIKFKIDENSKINEIPYEFYFANKYIIK
jgi:hypothetical protein